MAKEKETFDDKIKTAMSQLRPEGDKPLMVDCVVPETGETFTAEVQFSYAYPEGRVITLHNVKQPEDFVPRSLVGRFNEIQRKQWIWENSYQKLLRRFVYQPLAALGLYKVENQERIRKVLAEVK